LQYPTNLNRHIHLIQNEPGTKPLKQKDKVNVAHQEDMMKKIETEKAANRFTETCGQIKK